MVKVNLYRSLTFSWEGKKQEMWSRGVLETIVYESRGLPIPEAQGGRESGSKHEERKENSLSIIGRVSHREGLCAAGRHYYLLWVRKQQDLGDGSWVNDGVKCWELCP